MIEQNVIQIREQYNNIVSGISSGNYEVVEIVDGITAYYKDTDLKAITASKDYGNDKYDRYYYYNGNELFFAYYEGNDAHRFYFEKNQLIRWRYAANASDSQNAINYDLENTMEYENWKKIVSQEAFDLKNDWEKIISN